MSIPAQLGALLTGPEIERTEAERPTAVPAVVVELQQALGGKVAVDTAARTARYALKGAGALGRMRSKVSEGRRKVA